LVACVLAGKRSLQYHRQRGEQLSKHLSQHNYKRQGNHMSLSVNLGMVTLSENLGGAHQALIAAENAFELHTGHKIQAQKYPTQPSPQAPEKNTQTNHHAVDISKMDINKDLILAFQPIISLENTQIEHFSVLTRLRRNDGELIPAGQFINRIDKPGKRIELDRWMLQKAVSAMTEDTNTRESATLFVHLAHETLEQKSFFALIANVLRSSRLRGNGRLVFMLSEPWVVNNLGETQRITKALLDTGCGICLTLAGSTSRTRELIQQIPIHYLRLSPRVTGQAYDLPMLKAILEVTTQKKIHVIATHIEDSHNLSSLWMMGIRLFEGFFIQPPDSVFHLQNDIMFARELVQQTSANPR
jgi:EAL domain-containing protein (putative c-di-GMP-specific phosphodiesterase class I)